MKLLFLLFLSNSDWQNLRPEEKSGALHRRRNLSSEEREYLTLFQDSELQSRWGCRKIVVIWNVGLVLALLVLAQFFGINAQQIAHAVRSFFLS
jgi:hypothetical protein